MARRPYGINPSTRFDGPIVGSKHSGSGLFKDIPLGNLDNARSSWKVWVEDFHEQFADGQLETMGADVQDIGLVAGNTEVVSSINRFLLLNPGTADDTGVEVQFNIPPTAASLHSSLNTPNGLVVDADSLDGTELVWACRFGVTATTTTGSGKALLGWFISDDTLLVASNGLPSVAAGGGIGFHIGEDGVVTYLADQDAITTIVATRWASGPPSQTPRLAQVPSCSTWMVARLAPSLTACRCRPPPTCTPQPSRC
jgi:hypothetical protein